MGIIKKTIYTNIQPVHADEYGYWNKSNQNIKLTCLYPLDFAPGLVGVFNFVYSVHVTFVLSPCGTGV